MNKLLTCKLETKRNEWVTVICCVLVCQALCKSVLLDSDTDLLETIQLVFSGADVCRSVSVCLSVCL